MLFSVIVRCKQVVKGIALCVFFIRSICLEYWDAEGVKKKIEGRKKTRAVEEWECFQWKRRSIRELGGVTLALCLLTYIGRSLLTLVLL